MEIVTEWEIGMGIDCVGTGASGNIKKPFPVNL